MQESGPGKPSVNSGSVQAGRLSEWAAAAEKLMSFYPPCLPPNPKEFLAGMVATVQKFSMAAVGALIDPAKGYPAKESYLDLARINKFCEEFDARETAEWEAR